ncbi:MAG TPA: NBR1-Ig-like domain-containing protein [Pelolinea sp.]|nr:NBR1-Ig-like domain-containing protein [Pelolinea sp.]
MIRKNIFISTIALLVISAACTLPFSIQSSDSYVATYAAQTVQAYQTQNALTQTPLAPTATATPMPTFTPSATSTPKAAPTSTPQPCNRASFVSETVPDGTKINAGESFTKSWRLKNTGTCTWNPSYKLIFSSGDQMSGPNSVKLTEYVKPGEKTDILVDLKAPTKSGTYTGYWKLQAEDGDKFAQVYAKIQVPSAFFMVTSVKLSSIPASYTGACPTTLTIKAEITASTAGKVTYKWQRSDGDTSETKSVKFDSKGTETVQFDWDVNSTDIHWVKVYIDAPNHQWFGPVDIDVTCS